jgi:hypothetical protein
MRRNPKQDGSNLFDCIPQIGPCPIGCNQCFYNRPGAFYVSIDQPIVPVPQEVGDGIVRMNCGNDSNNQRELVIRTASQYKHAFYNTSIPRLDFPGPVVLTANPREEERAVTPYDLGDPPPRNLMFVRLRVSATNLDLIREAIAAWSDFLVPVVLIFMAYYDHEPPVPEGVERAVGGRCYEWRAGAHQPLLVPDQRLRPLRAGQLRRPSPRLLLRQSRRLLLPALPQL